MGGVVSEPRNSGKTLPLLDLWYMGRKCYRTPARAKKHEKGAAQWWADKYFTHSNLGEKNLKL